MGSGVVRAKGGGERERTQRTDEEVVHARGVIDAPAQLVPLPDVIDPDLAVPSASRRVLPIPIPTPTPTPIPKSKLAAQTPTKKK